MKTQTMIGIVCMAIVLGYAAYLFQLSGLRTVTGMLILFLLPCYMLLKNFEINEDERIFFSFFLGLSLFTLFVWYVDRIIPSLRLSILASIIILVSLGAWMKKFLKRKNRAEQEPKEAPNNDN